MENLELLWNDETQFTADPDEAFLHSETPHYQLQDGVNKYSIMCFILSRYFHSKHGFPLVSMAPSSAELRYNLVSE